MIRDFADNLKLKNYDEWEVVLFESLNAWKAEFYPDRSDSEVLEQGKAMIHGIYFVLSEYYWHTKKNTPYLKKVVDWTSEDIDKILPALKTITNKWYKNISEG